MLPVVARQADVWHTFGTVEELRKRARLLDAMIGDAGRPPSAVVRATDLSISEEWDDVRRRADGFREAGFTYLVVEWPTEGKGRLEEFVEKVMPDLEAA